MTSSKDFFNLFNEKQKAGIERMENTLKHEILSSPMGKLTTTENSIGDEFARILEFKGRNFTIAMSAWFTVVNDHDVVKQSPVGEIYSCIRQTHMKRQPTGSDFNFIASIITWIARMICKSSLQWKTFFYFLCFLCLKILWETESLKLLVSSRNIFFW